MFCFQCQECAANKGCTVRGVCGKPEVTSNLQDLLIYTLKGIALWAEKAREVGIDDDGEGLFVSQGLFTTITNANWDDERFVALIDEAQQCRDAIRDRFLAAYRKKNGRDFSETLHDAATWSARKEAAYQEKARSVGVLATENEDVRSLRELLIIGLKGIAAYADHAAILGKTDPAVAAFCYEALTMLLKKGMTVEQGVPFVLKAGEINLKAMELLDAANTSTYGHPVPTPVPLGHRRNKCILITGHDLHDLEMLLKQTEGKGIDIYTHGEMLPCHGYPELKKYPHFYGHFGTAWQNQQKEFPNFPGPILFTTNCIQKPLDSYKDRVFTNGLVGWPGVKHISDKDYSAVVDMALAMDGFTDDEDKGQVLVGFGRNAVLGVADKVIEAVKAKAIRHFFLVGGCDGAKPGRNYYTKFVEQVPKDCVVLTLACGKFRFFDMQLGDIGGIPRLLDVGQCNDAYSAIQIASALANAFGCGVNDLPLSMVLSWYEQKAVAILLTLLSLGIKGIRLGPSLPAFITPNVLNVLVENFDIKPITTPEEDLKAILG